jgi:Zn-dependent peptidase ImmA (M78 family)
VKRVSPEKKAEQVLDKFQIKTRPVLLEPILEKEGIRKAELDGGEDVFGAIVRQNGVVVIAINPRQHINRQRFTMAHELGHYYCHPKESMEYVDGDFRVYWRDQVSSTGTKWEEIDANRFAAALLIPERMLREDLDNCRAIDREAISRLATMYKVSRVAMQFRLINLGLLPPDVDPSAEA